jgi:hypothetical protein
VWRPAFFYPIPNLHGISIFGDAILQIKSGQTKDPVFLGASTVAPSDPSVQVVTQGSNRDYYHIGVGIDLLQFFKTTKFGSNTP